MPFNQQMSIPTELTLAGTGKDTRIKRWPAREIEALRGRRVDVASHRLVRGQPLDPDTKATLLDVKFNVRSLDARNLHVVIRGQRLILDWSNSELTFTCSPVSKLMSDRPAVSLPEGDVLSLRLLIDKTSVEVFINQGEISASYCFLPDAYIHPLVLEAYEGEQMIEDLELHELTPTWR